MQVNNWGGGGGVMLRQKGIMAAQHRQRVRVKDRQTDIACTHSIGNTTELFGSKFL